MKKYKLKTVIGAALLPSALAAAAQTMPPSMPQMLQQQMQQMEQATVRNEEQLHTYQWIESTTITVDGSPKPPQQFICRYAPDGTVIKTAVGLPPTEGPMHGPMKNIAERKRERVQGELAAIRSLTQAYLPLNQARFQQVLRTGNVQLEHDGTGAITLILKNYAKPGDQLRLTLNPMTMGVQQVSVRTYIDEPTNPITVDAHFAALPDRTVYAAFTSVQAPSEKLSVETADSNFSKVVASMAAPPAEIVRPYDRPQNQPSGPPLKTSAQLEQLVAPIALYPDALVAQILAAATDPTQVLVADRWVREHANLPPAQVAVEIDREPWDPSIKALTQFPSVLANMDSNLSWTSSLGEAYMSQQQGVMEAVQVMRQRARQAGTLTTNPQLVVSQTGQHYRD